MAAYLSLAGLWLLQAGGFDLLGIWTLMGVAAKIVVIILFIMSILWHGIMIVRALVFYDAPKQSRRFVTQV